MSNADIKLELRRWSDILTLLSLDVVIPFHGAMGLSTPDSGALQRILQTQIVTFRKQAEAPEDAVSILPVDRILDATRKTLGDDIAKQLVWWGTSVFYWNRNDNRNLSKWRFLLWYCYGDDELANRFGFLRRSFWDAFLQSLNLDEYRHMWDDVKSRPLSDWDLHIYALNLYDDLEVDDTLDGPSHYIQSTVRAYQGYKFWSEFLRGMTHEEQERFYAVACEINEEESSRTVRKLPHLTTLDIWA